MYQWVIIVGRFTATLSAATSWMAIYIVSGATHMSRLLDIYAANAGAQPLRPNKLTDETKGPVRQRREGGRPDRSQHLPCTCARLMKQRYVEARFHLIMTVEGLQRVDEATVLAAVDRLRAGGTAIGTSSPQESQMVRALRKFQVKRRASQGFLCFFMFSFDGMMARLLIATRLREAKA